MQFVTIACIFCYTQLFEFSSPSLGSNIFSTCLHYKNSLCVSVCSVLIVQSVEAAGCKLRRVLREICTFGVLIKTLTRMKWH